MLPPVLQRDLRFAGRLLPVLAHGALEVRQRAVGARRPGPAVLVAAPVAHAHAFAVDVEVAAVVVVAVVVADRTPAGRLGHVLVVREAAVLVRAQVARVVAGAVRVAVAAAVALVVSFGALGRTPVVLVGVAAEPVARAVRVLVAAPGAGVVPGGAALEVVGFDDGDRGTALIYRSLAMIV